MTALDMPKPPCRCVAYEPNAPDCPMHGICTCADEESWECPLHVRCDNGCKALVYPQTPKQVKAAYEHWRRHSNMHGCSHGH